MSIPRGAMVTTLSLLAILLSSPVARQPLHAEPAGSPTPLDVALVDSPAINCQFVTSCVWPVLVDDVNEIPLEGTNGLGRLQTRLFGPGETSTVGAGLYPYLYRFNFFEIAVTTPPAECVTTLSIPFGKIAPLDYDEDGEPDDLFIIQGTGGPSALASAEQLPDGSVTLLLATPLCPDAPGAENGSHFVGMAAELSSMTGEAVVGVSGGGASHVVETLVPAAIRIYLSTIDGE